MESKSSQPHWWWLAVAAITVLLAGAAIWNSNRLDVQKVEREQRQRAEDLARAERAKSEEEQRNRPHLKYLGGNAPGNDGFTHLKLQNMSPTRNAVIYLIEFQVADPQQLEVIAKVHPRIPPLIGTIFDKDEVKLVRGTWNNSLDRYFFYVYPDLYVGPDKPLDLATCIVDPLLANKDFSGELRIEVNGGAADEFPEVTLRAHRK